MQKVFIDAGFHISFENGPTSPNDWVKVITYAERQAVGLADKTGESFSLGEYGYGRTYTPRPQKLTKEEALNLISSGRELDYDLRQRIRHAIENGESEGEWYDSYAIETYGWVSSSQNC